MAGVSRMISQYFVHCPMTDGTTFRHMQKNAPMSTDSRATLRLAHLLTSEAFIAEHHAFEPCHSIGQDQRLACRYTTNIGGFNPCDLVSVQ